MKRKTKNTHFTIETRKIIEEGLNEGKSVTELSKLLHRDRSNIGREILKHREIITPSSFNGKHYCMKSKTCEFAHFECEKNCKNIEIEYCIKLNSSPHVCNSCNNKTKCRKAKYYYKAENANSEYQNTLINSRNHMHYSEEELKILNNDFRYLVLKNKSIYHSLRIINSKGFNFNRRVIYRQIRDGLLELKSSDLPRMNKRKIKTKKDINYKRSNITGHTFEEYLVFKENNEESYEIQMDTVQGIQGDKEPVLLTLQIVKIRFLFIFKIDNQTFESVLLKLIQLKDILSENIFNKLFEILLTDNGHEFIVLDKLLAAFPNINIFYCHPYSSFEKGFIENNHELIRRVIPKGISLKPYTQKELNLLSSHINSLYRECLDDKCPFDLIENCIPDTIIRKLGLKRIKQEDVDLSPYLLGDKNIGNIKRFLDDKDMKKANINIK